jgi:hypothetical protein
MSKLQPNKKGTRAVALNSATTYALAALFALVMLFAFATPDARAQSRRAPRPTATPTPEATPATTNNGESESESKPRATNVKDPSIVVSFSVMENDNPMMSLDYMARDDIWKAFIEQLNKSRAVSVTQAGKGTRGQARERAKTEREAYVVLFQIEEAREMGANAGIGRADTRTLVLKFYVFTPKTGDLKYSDVIYQRPYRETATIGGIPVPVPGGTRRIERYPSQLQLEQAARDAADSLLMRFDVRLPPDN